MEGQGCSGLAVAVAVDVDRARERARARTVVAVARVVGVARVVVCHRPWH
jgi:hypothetical protein